MLIPRLLVLLHILWCRLVCRNSVKLNFAKTGLKFTFGVNPHSFSHDLCLYITRFVPRPRPAFRRLQYGKAGEGLVSSPDQIFRARPADSSKNRVWTLSLRKLGQVYIWQAVNWVIVGVNYIIATSSVCFGAKKFASWLFMITHYAIYFT